RLLDDLLDVSRVSQGKIQLRTERVELAALLAQAVEVSRPVLAEKRHQLSVTPARAPLPLEADPTRLIQVFANIINNAAKYTDAGGRISIASATEGSEAVVTIGDDGMGMSRELLARASICSCRRRAPSIGPRAAWASASPWSARSCACTAARWKRSATGPGAGPPWWCDSPWRRSRWSRRASRPRPSPPRGASFGCWSSTTTWTPPRPWADCSSSSGIG